MNVEKKFNQFRQSLTQEEFSNIQVLESKYQQLKASDPELAKKLKTRIDNLDTESKFNVFKQSLTEEEFNDVSLLESRAKECKLQEPLLSSRILLRAERVAKAQKDKKIANFRQTLSKDDFNSIDVLKRELRKHNQDIVLKEFIEGRLAALARLSTPVKQPEPASFSAKSESVKSAESQQGPSSSKDKESALLTESVKGKLITWLRKPSILCIVIPTLVFAFYQVFWASERYESQAKVTVQQPDGTATMDASMAILTGLGVPSSSTSDTELIKTYIYSNDMLYYLNEELKLADHYSANSIDFFSRLASDYTQEDFLEFYLAHTKVEVNSSSGVVGVSVQGFEPKYTQLLASHIVSRAEWYINSIGHQLAQEQLKFIEGEHQLVENKLQGAQSDLLKFQQQYNLLDPTAEGVAMQQITYQLEGQIALKEAELKGLLAVMSKKAPRVLAIKNELDALKLQLVNERGRLANQGEIARPISEIMATFTDLKIKVELSLQAYTSSQVSLEKSRIEAYRQLKYLVVVEAPTLPQDNKYPDTFYNISLFLILAGMIFAISKIVILTIKELN
tara:strand:+ start:3860 stop:5551 length:1692 start_codon:yes stop_codon:yes gene_type:complete